jgi:hypothetical protein
MGLFAALSADCRWRSLCQYGLRAAGHPIMTCRIDRVFIEQGVVLRISGRITGEDLDVLRTALAEGRVVEIDLTEVELADRDAVALLARTEADGIALRHGPAYIREWMTRERGRS